MQYRYVVVKHEEHHAYVKHGGNEAFSEQEVTSSLRAVNTLLDEGWRPVRETPMGAAGGGNTTHWGAFSLVLLEKDG